MKNAKPVIQIKREHVDGFWIWNVYRNGEHLGAIQGDLGDWYPNGKLKRSLGIYVNLIRMYRNSTKLNQMRKLIRYLAQREDPQELETQSQLDAAWREAERS